MLLWCSDVTLEDTCLHQHCCQSLLWSGRHWVSQERRGELQGWTTAVLFKICLLITLPGVSYSGYWPPHMTFLHRPPSPQPPSTYSSIIWGFWHFSPLFLTIRNTFSSTGLIPREVDPVSTCSQKSELAVFYIVKISSCILFCNPNFHSYLIVVLNRKDSLIITGPLLWLLHSFVVLICFLVYGFIQRIF